MKLKNKGFTLIEILSVLVILSLVSVIGLVSVNMLVNSTRTSYYQTQEENLRLAGIEFIKANKNLSPLKGASQIIDIATLVNTNFVDEIVDANGKGCYDGRVIVDVNDKNQYEYRVCLKCGDYKSAEEQCKITYQRGTLNINLSTKSVDKNNNIIELVNYDGNFTWATNDVTMSISITEPRIQKYTIEKNGKYYKECIVKPENKDTNLCKITIPQSDLNNGINKFKVTALDIYDDNSIKEDNIIIKADKTKPEFKIKVDTKIGDKGIAPSTYNEANVKVQTDVKIFIGKNQFEGSGIKNVRVWFENDTEKTPITVIDGNRLDPTKDNEIPVSIPLLPGSNYKVIVEVANNAGNITKTIEEDYDVLMPIRLVYNKKGAADVSVITYTVPNEPASYLKNKYPEYNFSLPTKDKKGYNINWKYLDNNVLKDINMQNINLQKPTTLYVSYNPTCEFIYSEKVEKGVDFTIKMNDINPDFVITSSSSKYLVNKEGGVPSQKGEYYPTAASTNQSSITCKMNGKVVSQSSYTVVHGRVEYKCGPVCQGLKGQTGCPRFFGFYESRYDNDPVYDFPSITIQGKTGKPVQCTFIEKTSRGTYKYYCGLESCQNRSIWDSTNTKSVASKQEAENYCNKSYCSNTFANNNESCAKGQDLICKINEEPYLVYER